MSNAQGPLVARAQAEADAARARLNGTIALLKHRLDPRVVAAETAENMADRAHRFVSNGTHAVASRPALSATTVAAFLAAVGLRWWIARSRRDDEPETERR